MRRDTDDEDGNKNNHRRGTENLAKETGMQEAMGGSENGNSEDGVWEQSRGRGTDNHGGREQSRGRGTDNHGGREQIRGRT